MTNFLISLYILEISPLSDVELVKIFSHSLDCQFVLLTVSFALQKLFSFRRSHLLIVSLSVCAAGVIFKKWSPVPMCSRLLATFSSLRFSVAVFMWRFDPFGLEFCALAINMEQFAFFYMSTSSYTSTSFEDSFFFPLYKFSFFVKNQVFIDL